MRNIVYVAPFPAMATTHRFAQALAGLANVRLLGIVQQRPRGKGARIYDDVVEVNSTLDARQILEACELLRKRYGDLHRIVGILEDLQVQMAQVRGHYGMAGGDAEAAERFRDKGTMKDALRRVGIPCARHARLKTPADAWAFVEQVGYPIILKPPAGAGCRATYQVNDAAGLIAALAESRPSPAREVLAEEFLSGREYSFETITVQGRPQFYSISRYLPGPLEVTRNPWMQWVCLFPREVDGPEFAAVRNVGFNAVQRLGMHSGMTHMEWFLRPDGRVAVGEIAMRPPGAQFVSLMGWAYDTDMYRAWARAAVDDAFDGPFERKWAVSIAYLRGQGRGRVAAIRGLEKAQKAVGSLVVEVKLPTVGMPRSSSYEGDGYVVLRHGDTDTVAAATKHLIETLHVDYR